MGLAYYFFVEVGVEKFIKRLQVGRALVTFFGNVTTEDRIGHKEEHECGLFWNPWDTEGRVVAMENGVVIEGYPGDVTILVYRGSLKERTTIEVVPPSHATSGVWVYRYPFPLFVVIRGQATEERWAVSHWRMFSGRIVFDLAKNCFQVQIPEVINRPQNAEISDDQAQIIAAAQVEMMSPPRNGKRGKRHAEAN